MARSFLLWQRDAPLISAIAMGALRLGKVRVSRSLLLVLAAALWKVFSLPILDYSGVSKLTFGLDLIKGMERYFYEGEEFIAFVLQMDAPISLEQFKDHMELHFRKFPVFNS